MTCVVHKKTWATCPYCVTNESRMTIDDKIYALEEEE